MIKSLPIVIIAIVLFACSKKDSDTPQPGQAQRVKEIKDGAQAKTFLYDNENRVARIDFTGGSFRFTYSPTDITVQSYFSDDTPDPNWKYAFTVAGERITGGRRYLSNGAVGREYQYEYDNQQRLASVVMSLKNFTGDEDENHRYDFSYDGENTLQRVAFMRKNKTGNALVNSDSVSTAISYFPERSFITWKETGFNFFGSATAGIELQGMETMPFSFTFPERIVPAGKAVKTIDTKKYLWNQDTNTWNTESTSTQTFPETDYQYNQQGLLQQYKTNTISWEAY